MSAFFLDSSALVKRYVSEPGSAWLQDLTAPEARNQIIIARIAWVEVLSALARRQRDVSLSPTDVLQAMQSFRYDLDTQYQVVEVSRQLVETAGELVFGHPLRAYDSVQLAAALQIHAALSRAAVAALVLFLLTTGWLQRHRLRAFQLTIPIATFEQCSVDRQPSVVFGGQRRTS